MAVPAARPRLRGGVEADRDADAERADGREDQVGDGLLPGDNLSQRACFVLPRAWITSWRRSSGSSSPALSRIKPGCTSSPPQRARRSAVLWTPPKLVAGVTSLKAPSQPSAALWSASVKLTTGP